jgi:hypothetical protein
MTHSLANPSRDPADARAIVRGMLLPVITPARRDTLLKREPGYETQISLDQPRRTKTSITVPAPPSKTRRFSNPISRKFLVIYQPLLSKPITLWPLPDTQGELGLRTCHARLPSHRSQHYLDHPFHQTIQACPRQLLPSQKCPTQPLIVTSLCLPR